MIYSEVHSCKYLISEYFLRRSLKANDQFCLNDIARELPLGIGRWIALYNQIIISLYFQQIYSDQFPIKSRNK